MNSEQGIREWKESKHDTIDDLIKAFVNDNITKGNASNLTVYGNTLYADEGNDGRNLWYFQLAIRLSDDIYIINIREKHKPCQIKIYKQAAIHTRARYRYIHMPTINHKQVNGRIEPSILKSIISDEPPGRVKSALKKYGRERMHEQASENHRYLISTYAAMQTPGRVELSKGIIRDMAGALKKARKISALFDERLDVLKQLPGLQP